MSNLETLRDMLPYQAQPQLKQELMLEGLNDLGKLHYENCEAYQRIIDGLWHKDSATSAKAIEDIPYLPVSLFKKTLLSSVNHDDVKVTLTSSGTTGMQVSQIVVDAETSRSQQVSLANSMGHILGKKRLPMLVVDTDSVFKDPAKMSARGAGVLGMMRFGYKPAFMLDSEGNPSYGSVDEFLEQYSSEPFFIFGFTFMVWVELYQKFASRKLDLSNGILVHSGGWKKMEEQSVSAAIFREKLADAFGLEKVYNFYGMVEQIGSIFLEGERGLLFPPNFTDVIIRDPVTFEPVEDGQEGIIQVLSLIPTSYPGHSLLTEDMGHIERVENSEGFTGKGLRISGRISQAELRGCSDVIASEAARG